MTHLIHYTVHVTPDSIRSTCDTPDIIHRTLDTPNTQQSTRDTHDIIHAQYT